MQLNINRQAALDTLAWSEGTSTSPITHNDGYDVIVTGIAGREVFTDYSKHPFADGRKPKVINRNGLESTASGRYQILLRYWKFEAQQQGYPSFEPEWQDDYTLRQWSYRHALTLIDAGQFDQWVSAISGLWASMPGRKYTDQNQHSIDTVRAVYLKAGGLLTRAPLLSPPTP